MTRLAHDIRVRARYARSTNLERDGDTLALADYVPTARSLDMVRRFAAAAVDQSRIRAWSVTGPYGSGKSSFALFLDGLVGGASNPARQTALDLIETIDRDLADLVRGAYESLRASDRGVIRAVITADPEPVTITVLRALERGLDRYWPRGRKPSEAKVVLDALAATIAGDEVAPRDLVRMLRELTVHAPLLIVLDEFGKNLDYLRDAARNSDLYLLQAIAEAASGPRGLPVYLMTLQHLSFDDYASNASTSQRREWAKVQGRFEDVVFLDSPEQTIRLMSRVFEPVDAGSTTARRIAKMAARSASVAREVGLSDVIGDEGILARTYPLHPSVVAVLPELCRRYGQNERTLFSFLSHDETHAVGHFLASTDIAERGPLPVIRLADVFDYFVGSVSVTLGVSPESARWFEIHDRISQAIGLTDTESNVLKTVGLLNLIAQGGTLRASALMVAYALGRPDVIPAPSDALAVLGTLERRGFITYRAFASEYRLWQGSDFDMEGRIDLAKRAYELVPFGEIVAKALALPPVVASRYSQERGIVRVFGRQIVEHINDIGPLANGLGSPDGWIYYLLSASPLTSPRMSVDAPPVVVVQRPELLSLREPLIEAAAAADVLTSSKDIDWVARRELEERAGQSLGVVQAALAALLQTIDGGATLLGPGKPETLPATRTLSELASIVCDRRYPLAPTLRNEMLARDTLTSQAARARLDLMAAMVSHPSEAHLGIRGYGPERAMYEAILFRSGIHSSAGDAWTFGPPSRTERYGAAWRRIDELIAGAIEDRISVAAIQAALRRPPLGLKPPIVPILLTAYLLVRPNEIAIYQDGTFQPRLTSDLLERLTKAPERFELRFLSVQGTRLAVLRALATEFDLVLRSSTRQQAAPLLSIVAPLLETVRQLPEYTLRTARLGREASAVRTALLQAREPDQLIFDQLPRALGYPAIRAHAGSDVKDFAASLHGALAELQQAYPTLLERIATTISSEFSLHQRNSLKVEAAARARPLLSQVADTRLRSLLFVMTSDALDDNDWLEAIGLAISGRPPQAWQADDEELFAANAASLLGSFRRVEALYFDGRADSPAGFLPRKVTVTHPDGSEVSRVVWVDESQLPVMSRMLQETRAMIARELPTFGEEALLATLADQILRSARHPMPDDEDGELNDVGQLNVG
jgi:hypothetical protein